MEHSHLTSTSPPVCITNEPSGCFTDHRKSNSFSLEKGSVGGDEEEREEGVGVGVGRERTEGVGGGQAEREHFNKC